jgi:hypothetical protein
MQMNFMRPLEKTNGSKDTRLRAQHMALLRSEAGPLSIKLPHRPCAIACVRVISAGVQREESVHPPRLLGAWLEDRGVVNLIA